MKQECTIDKQYQDTTEYFDAIIHDVNTGAMPVERYVDLLSFNITINGKPITFFAYAVNKLNQEKAISFIGHLDKVLGKTNISIYLKSSISMLLNDGVDCRGNSIPNQLSTLIISPAINEIYAYIKGHVLGQSYLNKQPCLNNKESNTPQKNVERLIGEIFIYTPTAGLQFFDKNFHINSKTGIAKTIHTFNFEKSNISFTAVYSNSLTYTERGILFGCKDKTAEETLIEILKVRKQQDGKTSRLESPTLLKLYHSRLGFTAEDFSRNFDGLSLIELVINYGDIEFLHLVLQDENAKAVLLIGDRDGRPPIRNAIAGRNIEVIKAILEYDVVVLSVTTSLAPIFCLIFDSNNVDETLKTLLSNQGIADAVANTIAHDAGLELQGPSHFIHLAIAHDRIQIFLENKTVLDALLNNENAAQAITNKLGSEEWKTPKSKDEPAPDINPIDLRNSDYSAFVKFLFSNPQHMLQLKEFRLISELGIGYMAGHAIQYALSYTSLETEMPVIKIAVGVVAIYSIYSHYIAPNENEFSAIPSFS